MLRAIKIRLYPNKAQEQTLNKVLGCYRFIYNQMLARKQNAYKADKTNLSVTDLSKWFHGTLLKDEQYAWLKEQNTKVMKQAIRQMDGAYQKFFKQHNGFPKFKTKKDKQTALFPIDAISRKNTFETRHITLITSLKNIKFRCSDLYFRRLQKYNKDIRSATLSKTKSGNFFLSILVEMNDTELKRFERTNKQVGIDLGVKDFVITSDGEVFENKHFFKKKEKQVRRLQRQISRKVKGSNNRKKAQIRIARLYERITNKKDAYIHYITNELLTYFDTIFMENLNVKGMMKNHHLAKAIQEVGLYKFKETLVNKAAVNDKKVVFIDRFYPSSKTCSGCGYKKRDLKLSDRFWVCPECGSEHDRDINAARNILLEGQRMLAAV
jgi:putative transposase